MGVIIVNGIEYSGAGGGSGDIRYLTQAEYDALPDSKYTDDVEYRITDAGIDEITASNVGYRNSVSGLQATTVQQAIDVLNDSVANVLNDSFVVINGITNVALETNTLIDYPEGTGKHDWFLVSGFVFYADTWHDIQAHINCGFSFGDKMNLWIEKYFSACPFRLLLKRI